MFPRETKVSIANNEPIEFQILSWHTCDFEYSYDDNIDEEDSLKYLVKVFGVTSKGHSVSANILNFTPFFFIKVCHKVDRMILEKFREFMVSKLPFHLQDSLLNVKLLKKKDFWGFYNGEKFNFIRFTFKNLQGFRAGIRILSKDIYIVGLHNQKKKYKLYESNIDPFLRLIHLKNIDPAGWVRLENYEHNDNILISKCQIDVNVDWRKIQKINVEKIAPIMVASFDIECVSSHGDFPVARKDYKKVAYEFYQLYERKKDTIDDLREYMMQQLLGIFDPQFEGEMSKVFVKEPLTNDALNKIHKRLKVMIDDILIIASGKLVYKTDSSSSNSNGIPSMNKDDIMKNLTTKFGHFETICDERTNSTQSIWQGIFPKLEGDPIIQIGTTVHNYGDKECRLKHIISLGSCDPIEGVIVETCETEQELLLKWCELIDKIDPDIMTGYNILGFDMSYMYERAIELGIKTSFCKIGRLQDHASLFQEKVLSSSALGDNILKFLDMEGRVLIDVMKVVQRDHKLDSYKLDAVASHFMKMNKNDVSPNDIFRLFRGDSADRKIISEYCVQDCALCNHLMMKLEIIANNIGMANVCSVPFSFIFMRGQGIKIFSLVAKQCKEDEFLIPTINKGKLLDNEEEEGYEGAIVLEPKTGIYTEDPISVLDYASLYPSSMISENLSHDCYVEKGSKYDNLKGVEYLDISYDIYEKINDKKVKVGEKICRFTQNEKGVIPRILMKLIKQRKETRKKIEYKTITTINGDKLTGLYTEEDDKVILKTIEGQVSSCLKSEVVAKEDTYDDFTKAVLDGLQLAYKVTANSLYGQIGARTSPIYLKDIAACTTATGRNMILKAKDFIEGNYIGANIVYGDSVTGDTPLIVKFQDGHIDIITIETLTKDWFPYENFKPFDIGRYKKEQSFTDAKIWTDEGWADIHRVIRHKTSKKMYRVTTFQGSVDVTEDHSLIGKNMQQVKPIECKIGETEILHSFPNDTFHYVDETDYVITKEEAWLWGAFFKNGHCDIDSKCWCIEETNEYILENMINILRKIEPSLIFHLDVNKNTTVLRNNSLNLINKYRQLFYNRTNHKKVPAIILNAPLHIRRYFLRGAKVDVPNKHMKISCNGKIETQGIVYLLHSIGYQDLIIDNQQNDIYIIRTSTDMNEWYNIKDKVNEVIQIKDCTIEEYVYDIETAIGRFHGGIGSIILKNTDSLMVAFPNEKDDGLGNKIKMTGKEAVEHAIKVGTEVSQKFKAYLKPPHDLEMEKVFYPFILISKKRYCAIKYENDPSKGKFNSMGIALKRRDNAPIVKKIYGGVIDIIMQKQDIEESITFLKSSIQNLIDGKYPIEDLIISKSLRADYKDPTRIAHKALAERMGERDPGNKPQVNDRIPYVYIDVSNKSSKTKQKILQGDRIEHPEYIRKMQLKPDYEFYITNQIMKPVSQIYALILEDMRGYKKGKNHFKEVETKLITDKNGDMKKVKERLNDLRENEVQELLFKPFLTKLENKRNGNREITDWFKIS